MVMFGILRSVQAMILTAAAAAFLSACPSFKVSSPVDGSIFLQPEKTTVIVETGTRMSNLVVKVDGVDYSNQMNSMSDTKSQGDLSLSAGKHIITVDVDVSCWYCSGSTFHDTASRSVCVGVNAPAVITKIVHAKTDDKVWLKTSDTSIGMATDDGTLKVRWNLLNLRGPFNKIGLIISTENNCLCMRSTDAHNGTPIALAVCDNNDQTQWWDMQPGPDPNTFTFVNVAGSGNQPGLTEGPNGVLIQTPLNVPPTSNQLWKIWDVTNQQYGPPF